MSKSIRDLLTVKVTVPVGYDMLKFIHTNMFIKMKVPDEFKVENFEHIANAMNNKYNRYYKYITSIAINKNRKLFRKLCETKGEVYARLFLYCSHEVVAVSNEYINLEDYEQ